MGSVFDVFVFCICDDYVGGCFLYIVDGFFEWFLVLWIEVFVKSDVWFVSYVVIVCCIDDCFIESENWVGFGF